MEIFHNMEIFQNIYGVCPNFVSLKYSPESYKVLSWDEVRNYYVIHVDKTIGVNGK